MITLNNYPFLKSLKPNRFFLLAGPCVIEDEESPFKIAERLVQITKSLDIPFVFKGSYRKANRSRLDSFQGIGDERALNVLKNISKQFNVPVVTDIHSGEEAAFAAEYVDILQIPAFLCRQTDIKKGQFLSGESMRFAVEKVQQSGNQSVMLTDRGNFFGYQDLVVDYRNIFDMQKNNVPVIMDVTHSLQQPNQTGGVTGGKPELIELISKAAIAVGTDGLFMETHPNPAIAKSDGANMLRLDLVEPLLEKLVRIKESL